MFEMILSVKFINIVRNTQSTLGIWLASQINIPYFSLDHYCWQPGWRETPRDEFRNKVQTALEQNGSGWIIDGSYSGRVGDLVDREATDIICMSQPVLYGYVERLIRSIEGLDPPLLLYLPRLCLRSLLRILSRSPPCSPGCQETLARTFSSESVIWWCITNHSRVRRRETAKMQELNTQNQTIMRRIGGWGSELRQWRREITTMP